MTNTLSSRYDWQDTDDKYMQTYDVVISRRRSGYMSDEGWEPIKRLNFHSRFWAEKKCDSLSRDLEGIGLLFEVMEGQLLNKDAIRSNRQEMLDAQIRDLPDA